MARSLLFLLSLTLVFFAACETPEPDPCAGVVCANNGTCDGGLCECPDGFTGPDCTEPDFKVMVIHKIKVENLDQEAFSAHGAIEGDLAVYVKSTTDWGCLKPNGSSRCHSEIKHCVVGGSQEFSGCDFPIRVGIDTYPQLNFHDVSECSMSFDDFCDVDIYNCFNNTFTFNFQYGNYNSRVDLHQEALENSSSIVLTSEDEPFNSDFLGETIITLDVTWE